MIIFLVIIVLIIVVIAVVASNTKQSGNKPETTSKGEKQQYTTILRIGPSLPSATLGCKNGIIYVPSSTHDLGRAAGSYKQDSDGDWIVYGDEQYEIGRIHQSSNDIRIYLTGSVPNSV